jgi:ferritin
MLNDKLQTALNDQIQREMYSAYIYLAMSANCDERNLTGFATWMKMQAQEEMMHAMRIYDHILERGGTVILQAIEQPPSEFGSPLDIMEKSLAHERFITGQINELYDLAVEVGDRPAQVMLQWFITEQMEEESTVDDIVERLKMFGQEGAALLMVDTELGSRTTTA